MHKPAYNRYHPQFGLVATSMEYEIGDHSPNIMTIEWQIHLIQLDGQQYLQPRSIKRHNGEIVPDEFDFRDIVAVKRKTSILSQAYKMLSELTVMALSAKQYEERNHVPFVILSAKKDPRNM
jgi:hypothetical protein